MKENRNIDAFGIVATKCNTEGDVLSNVKIFEIKNSDFICVLFSKTFENFSHEFSSFNKLGIGEFFKNLGGQGEGGFKIWDAPSSQKFEKTVGLVRLKQQ